MPGVPARDPIERVALPGEVDRRVPRPSVGRHRCHRRVINSAENVVDALQELFMHFWPVRLSMTRPRELLPRHPAERSSFISSTNPLSSDRYAPGSVRLLLGRSQPIPGIVGRPSNHPCPKCESTRTIRMAMEKSHDYWRCFACGQKFDVPNKPDTPERRVSDKPRKVDR